MKAIVQDRYGSSSVLELLDVDRPVPTDDQVLVHIRAASVNPLDWHYMRGQPYLVRLQTGLRRPRPKYRRRGADLAGVVEAVGRNVTAFGPGDEVYGQRGGAFAEYKALDVSDIVPKPSNLTFEEAAAVPVAAITALQALRKGRVAEGHHVLVNGAAGGVGTFAVQIAKSYGAHVTGVCSSRNVDMVRGIGADDVVDYTEQDFTQTTRRFDVIIDNVGTRSLTTFRRLLTPRGTYVSVGAVRIGNWIWVLTRAVKLTMSSLGRGQRMVSMLANTTTDDLHVLNGLLEAGSVKPVIDRTYTLPEVPEAIRHVEEGHARAKVVITI